MKKFLKNLFKLREDVELERSVDLDKVKSEQVKIDLADRRFDR